MRNVKFRAWKKSARRWIGNGDATRVAICGDVGFLCEYGEVPNGPLEPKIVRLFTWKEMQDLIFVQSTGFKDRNGREIYEGDVCRLWDKRYSYGDGRHPSKFIRVIRWNDTRPQFNFFNAKRLEVIGNIYENPELLSPEE